MCELRHGFVVTQRSPEIRIHYVEVNNRPHNPLIVFLHGFPEHWYSWKDYLIAVAKEGYHGVALDLRGYNDSSKPEEIEAYHSDRLVNDVRLMIKHFGNKSTFVVGNDLGGFITLELANQSPGILNGIVLVNAPEMMESDGSKMTFFDEAHELKLLTKLEIVMYKQALGPVSPYGRGTAKKKIVVPTLLIRSGKGPTIGKSLFSGGITERFYPNSSHWVHLEHSNEIQNELLYFFSLNRLKGHKFLATNP